MQKKNPYAISFGRIPTKYINRNAIIDSVIDAIDSDYVDEQAFKLTGIRGTGKTVTLSAIEKKLKNEDDWIVIGIRSSADILTVLLSELYSSVPFLTSFVDAQLNLSAFGIGLNISKKSPTTSCAYALKQILGEVKRKGKKVLITIDEARKTESMIDFVQEFQILIREELPIYLVVAGLYEDIESIENTDGLTFFLRATKYEMTPLNHTSIRDDYQKTIGVDFEQADKMAAITKGYAFAYQALGKYVWEDEGHSLSDEVLRKLDDALAEKVYNKLWSELAPKDQWFLEFIAQKDQMSASELLAETKKKHNEWSEPRKRLREKGIIDTSVRGMIVLKLPRLKQYIENRQYM